MRGTQTPSGHGMNRGEAAALAGGLQRMPSGNVYDGFPCIRVGDFVLPSSMDLRAPFVLLPWSFRHMIVSVGSNCNRDAVHSPMESRPHLMAHVHSP